MLRNPVKIKAVSMVFFFCAKFVEQKYIKKGSI